MESRWRHRDGYRLWCCLHCHDIQGRQSLGATGCLSLSFWNVGFVCSLNHLSHPTPSLYMERTIAPLGPCCHLLAYRRFLFATHLDCPARARLLGVEPLFVCMGLCYSWYHHEFHQVEGAFQRRDFLLRWYGLECIDSFQASSRFRFHSSRHLDYSRRRLLYHRRPLLFIQQKAIYALRLPLLRPGWQHLPHHRRLGRVDGVPLNIFLLIIAVIPKTFVYLQSI